MKLSQKEKDKYYDITNMWNLKYDPNELICGREIDIANKFMFTKGERGWGRSKLGVWD